MASDPEAVRWRAAARHPAAFVAVAAGLLILGSVVMVWLAPIALIPFQCHEVRAHSGSVISESCRMLFISERASYAACVIFSGYAAGYKACQLNLCPMYVQRALTLSHSRSSSIHRALAPFYAMGLVHASRGRLITSWTVTLLVSLVVVLIRHLKYPQRSIIGAGVVTGLTWGAISIVVLYVRAFAGLGAPGVDPQLPDGADRAELAPGDEEMGAAEDKPSARRAVSGRARRMLQVIVLSLLALLLVLVLPGVNSCLRSEACTSCLRSEACTSCVSPNAAQLLYNHAITPWSGCNASAAGASADASRVAAHAVQVELSKEDLLDVCGHFCPLCPQPPRDPSSMNVYGVILDDGAIIPCRPTRTREGHVCFCNDD